MGLSRILGFTFCGKHITNLDFNLDTYKVISIDKPITPKMTYREFVVPNRHGSKRYDDRYEDITIKVVVGVTGTAFERQQKITLLLQEWIGKEEKLFFDDRPNLFYKARFYDAITSKDTGTFTEITISFECSYCMYELYHDLRDYQVDDIKTLVDDIGALVNRAEWEINKPCIKQVKNNGNFVAQPLFNLNGVAELLTIQMNNVAFSLKNLNGEVFIDSENMVVYEIINGKKISRLQDFIGKFPTIATGESDIDIGGKNLDLTITVDFRNTYIV